jgi:hypothetical protein
MDCDQFSIIHNNTSKSNHNSKNSDIKNSAHLY